MVSQESLSYSCNVNDNVVVWSSSVWTCDLAALAGNTPAIPMLSVSGVDLAEVVTIITLASSLL